MKLQEKLQLATLAGLVVLFANGTTGSAKTIGTQAPIAPISEASKSAALAAADDKVDALGNKRDTARKQLNAARANLRAAELELKAARADRDALAMRETAQNLAQDSGFVSGNNYPRQVAAAGSRLQSNNDELRQAPKNHSLDFNAEPVGESPNNVP